MKLKLVVVYAHLRFASLLSNFQPFLFLSLLRDRAVAFCFSFPLQNSETLVESHCFLLYKLKIFIGRLYHRWWDNLYTYIYMLSVLSSFLYYSTSLKSIRGKKDQLHNIKFGWIWWKAVTKTTMTTTSKWMYTHSHTHTHHFEAW